jgi:hypothetical protein
LEFKALRAFRVDKEPLEFRDQPDFKAPQVLKALQVFKA